VALAQRSFLEEAAAALRRAASLDPRSEFYLNLSIVYGLLNNYEGAGKSVAKGIEMDPTDARLRGQLCVTDLYTNQFAAAAACLEEIQKSGPLDDYYSTAYGIALLHSGSANKAIEILAKVVQSSPRNYTAQNALGMAYFMLKDYPKAGEIFKNAVEIAPQRGQARYNLAIVQLMRQNRAGALSQYKLLQESSPSIADKLSCVLFKDKVLFVGNK
jgi:tetratricopeptide (TPR) repeat protein